jgi:hypothetical protein
MFGKDKPQNDNIHQKTNEAKNVLQRQASKRQHSSKEENKQI